MVEVLAYVPFQKIELVFLNRSVRITMERNNRDPRTFLADANAQIDKIFASGPTGGTPALEKMQESINRGRGSSIARYFFGDGVPNGGHQAQTEILKLVKNRQDPAGNPITFISCTNDDNAVEWMKDTEEAALYCSESDDFGDESREVSRDQGKALPYSKGFHLMCQSMAAMCPDDLDAMDESVPFTKTTLDNLLGVQHNEESYRHYFNCFEEAQRSRSILGQSGTLRKNIKWNYNDFVSAPVARDIPQVRDFKAQLDRIG